MQQERKAVFFVLGDGNKIREHVERYLLSGELEALERLSQRLINAVHKVKFLAMSTMNAKVIMAGGDDILLCIDQSKYRREFLEQLSDVFEAESGATISFGVGRTIEVAYLNLRRAKSSKSNHIIEGDISE
jgi:hypothetical protein